MYIELHAASAFSFLQGASLPETLIERAATLGYPAMALLDADGVYGAPRFHKAATKAGLRAIIGAELTIEATGGTARTAPHRWRLPVLVASAEGYRNLCRLVTKMKLRAAKGEGALLIEELDGYAAGLVGLPGRALLDAQHYGVGGLLDRLAGIFGRGHVYVDVQRHLLRDEESDNTALSQLAQAFKCRWPPPTACASPRRRSPAVRRADLHPPSHHARCRRAQAGAQRRALSEDARGDGAAVRRLARGARGQPGAGRAAGIHDGRPGLPVPQYPVPPAEYGDVFPAAHYGGGRPRSLPPVYTTRRGTQIEHELALIEKLDLAGYFLIVWDIVSYCRQHDILVQGRGSAANSAVCYSLGITAVDPIAMELLFERFLSEERGEWPDIDLDLPSGDRREQVIQHVYEKYGRLGAAMTANVITYRGRSAAREVGKALALDAAADRSPGQGDAPLRVRSIPHETLARNLDSRGAVDRHAAHQVVCAELWRQDAGPAAAPGAALGRHGGVPGRARFGGAARAGEHAGPRRDPVGQGRLRRMGIVKVDLLGLGMMAVLQDALGLINTTLPAPVELAHIPPDDPAVYDLLQKADTIGVFQVESRAQMATLPRLKPRKFYDLVVEVAIIRPGPIVGQMVHPYLNRRAGREPVVPLHPLLEPVLARTLGVPLFQEQLLRMAMVAANFTGGQAEELAARDGVQALREAHAADRHAAARGDGGQRHHGRDRRDASSPPSPRSRSTAFPSRTRPASRCWPTPARI